MLDGVWAFLRYEKQKGGNALLTAKADTTAGSHVKFNFTHEQGLEAHLVAVSVYLPKEAYHALPCIVKGSWFARGEVGISENQTELALGHLGSCFPARPLHKWPHSHASVRKILECMVSLTCTNSLQRPGSVATYRFLDSTS